MQTTESFLGRIRNGLCWFFAIVLCVLPVAVDLQAKTPDIADKLDVVYARHDGEPVLLDAYLLSGPGLHPAVVFVHGGGFVGGDKAPCPSYILAPFLEHGFSVVSVNYRLAPQHPFPAAIEDVATSSTITHIRTDMPPYLLVHGTRDHGVPYEQSVSLQQAMLKKGADCTLFPVVGGGHGNWTPLQWKDVEDFEFAWLEQKMRRH